MRSPTPYFLLVLLPITILIFLLLPAAPTVTPATSISCIYTFSPPYKNKFALLLASHLNVPFYKCSAPSPPCTFNPLSHIYYTCAPSDCDCLYAQFNSPLQTFSRIGCRSLGVLHDNHSHPEFHGCLSALSAQIDAPRPQLQYDVFYYAKHDFKGDSKHLLLNHLCKLSDRPIIILATSEEALPACSNRLLLARGLKLEQQMRIIKFAHHIAVPASDSAHLLLQVANPKRMILLTKYARQFEYVACDKWTVVNDGGGVFHFDSKERLIAVLRSKRNLAELKEGDEKLMLGDKRIPRKWNEDMMTKLQEL